MTDTGAEFGLSLLVGGSWLTGIAITPQRWLDLLTESLGTEPDAAPFSELLQHITTAVYPTSTETSTGTPNKAPADNRHTPYLHLRNAQLLTGLLDNIPADGGLVRIRIEHIAAWLLGNIAPETLPSVGTGESNAWQLN